MTVQAFTRTYMETADSGFSAQTTSQEEVFTRLVNAHLDEIYNFARYMLQDYDEANDIAQKTFLSLYQNLSKLDLQTPVRPWLFRVARNHCLDHLKKKKAVQFSQLEDEQVFEIPSGNPSIEANLDDSLFMEKVREHVGQLPPPMKEVILLKYFDDLTFEQIADIQGASVNTVKSHFYRGKERLYRLIDKNDTMKS